MRTYESVGRVVAATQAMLTLHDSLVALYPDFTGVTVGYDREGFLEATSIIDADGSHDIADKHLPIRFPRLMLDDFDPETQTGSISRVTLQRGADPQAGDASGILDSILRAGQIDQIAQLRRNLIEVEREARQRIIEHLSDHLSSCYPQADAFIVGYGGEPYPFVVHGYTRERMIEISPADTDYVNSLLTLGDGETLIPRTVKV